MASHLIKGDTSKNRITGEMCIWDVSRKRTRNEKKRGEKITYIFKQTTKIRLMADFFFQVAQEASKEGRERKQGVKGNGVTTREGGKEIESTRE